MCTAVSGVACHLFSGAFGELQHDTLRRHSDRKGVVAVVFRRVGGPVEQVSKAGDRLHCHLFCSVARMIIRVHWTTASRVEMLVDRGAPFMNQEVTRFWGGTRKGTYSQSGCCSGPGIFLILACFSFQLAFVQFDRFMQFVSVPKDRRVCMRMVVLCSIWLQCQVCCT